jgi:hypothetical protein
VDVVVGVVAAAAGVETVSGDAVVAAGVVSFASGAMTVSEDGLTIAASAVCVAESLRAWADRRVGTAASAEDGTASAPDVLTVVAEEGLAGAVGATASALGGVPTVVAEDGLAGAAASTAGVPAVVEDGLTVSAGAAASTAGVPTVVAVDGLAVAAGVLAAPTAAGAMTRVSVGLTVVAGIAAVAVGATAVAAQCSEIMLKPVTAKLLSAAPELAVPLVLLPKTLTSWPRCSLRSTLLVVILRI